MEYAIMINLIVLPFSTLVALWMKRAEKGR